MARSLKDPTFSALSSISTANAVELVGDFNISVSDVSSSGAWSGSAGLYRSYDQGVTFHLYETFTAPTEVVDTNPELGVLFVFNPITHTAGSVKCRLSQ